MAREAFADELLSLGGGETDLLLLSSRVGAEPAARYQKTYGLDPGEYTPQWDKAELVSEADVATVHTPILSQYLYAAVDEKNWEETQCVVTVKQTLVTERRAGSPGITNFIVSAIPDAEYAVTEKETYQRQTVSSANNFSGVLLYHSLDGELRRAERYKAGKLLSSMNETNMPVTIEDFMDQINELIGEWSFFQITANVYSKFSDDPEYGWEGNNITSTQVEGMLHLFQSAYKGQYVEIGQFVSMSEVTTATNNAVVNIRGETIRIQRVEMVNTKFPGSTNYLAQPNRKVTVSNGNINYIYINQNSQENLNLYLTPSEAQRFENTMGYTFPY